MLKKSLRKGWTTGTCATAATKAALIALITGKFPDSVMITLPKGERSCFQSKEIDFHDNFYASAGIIKDAGDDPDVTDKATIITKVNFSRPGNGISFYAGTGVGIVTRKGLKIPPGEPAINPIPRQMMEREVKEICKKYSIPADIKITISVPNGEKIALNTWNPRLGIRGGISILGTTGIVRPFSCSAWIHAIHRNIDIIRSSKESHAIASTGSQSEKAAQKLYQLPEFCLLDIGDFIGGTLKYLRTHPIDKLTLSGGFAKFTKLAQGSLNLHSSKSQVDKNFLWNIARREGLKEKFHQHILSANTAKEILDITLANKINFTESIAKKSKETVLKFLKNTEMKIEIIIVNQEGDILARI